MKRFVYLAASLAAGIGFAGFSLAQGAATSAAPTPAAPAPARGPFGGGMGGGGRVLQPSIQGGDNSRIAHEQHLAKAKLGKIDIYFEGDSIARRWGAADASYAKYLANWKENFFGWNAADFGWGADRIENILWRLQNGEIDNVNPKIVVFLGGTNNLNPSGGDANAQEISNGIKACVDVIQKKAPDAVIILTGVFPRTPANDIPIINKINDNLSKMADGKKIRYININDKIMGKDGKIIPGMLNTDNLHPDTKGYQAWADALKPIFTEILGPPAKEDHAPPASGDPKTVPVYPPPAATVPAAK